METSLHPSSVDLYLGKRLKKRRLSCGLTQQDLAKKVGVTVQQIHKYEKGIDRLSASRLLMLARFLSIPVTFFYEGLEPFNTEMKKMVLTWDNVKGKHFTIQFLDEEGVISDIQVI